MAQGAGVGLGKVAALGLGEVLLLDGTEGELHGVVAVLLGRLDGGHRARAGLEDRDACDGAIFLEQLGHAQLLGKNRGHDQMRISMSTPRGR